MKGRSLQFVILVALLGCLPRGRADTAPAEAVTLIRCARQKLDCLLNTNAPEIFAIHDYFSEIENTANWTAILKQEPSKFADLVHPLHEIMQFYFGGRTDYEQRTFRTLVELPRIPWDPEKVLSPQQLTTLAEADLCLRIAWFRLFSDLGPRRVIESDPEFNAPGLAIQFLRDFEKPHLLKVMTARDWDVVMEACTALPVFTEAYAQDLAFWHAARFPTEGYYAKKGIAIADRGAEYTKLARHFRPTLERVYRHLWTRSPAVFDSRAEALARWIDWQFNKLDDVLTACAKMNEGRKETARCFLAALNDFPAWPTWAIAPPSNARAEREPTSKEIGYVKELNEHLNRAEDRFDLDDVGIGPLSKAMIEGSWKQAANAGFIEYPVKNLRRPVALLNDYAARHPNERLCKSVIGLKARLDQLRGNAEKMAEVE